MAGDGELNRIIKDLQKTVAKLNCSYREQNLPVTDGSRELHSLCAQLEFLLQFDLKEKRSFFGQRKDYWDFLCQGLARRRQEHEGIRFVTSLDKLKTPVGRGRAFLRYCLVHRQLAESLQLCLLDPESLCEWYYARSPFLSPQRRAEILGSLYELNGITFHLALTRADLDTAWPMFSEWPQAHLPAGSCGHSHSSLFCCSHIHMCTLPTLVRPRPVARSCPALQTDNTDAGAYGWPDGITHPTAATCSVPAHPCPPTLAALWVGAAEVEDVERHVEDMEAKKDIEEEDEDKVQKNYEVEEEEVEDVEVDVDVKEYEEVEEDVEEEDAEELEEDEMEDVDVEELKDEHVGGKAPQRDSDGELDTPPLTGMRCTPRTPSQVPRQLGGMEASLQVLVSQLRTKLRQQEAASRALAAQLAQEKRRHRHWEEDSAQWVQLQAREAEALRETNTFLEQALAAAVAAGDLGVLTRAQEEAQSWQKAAEERDAQLARVLAEAAALSSRLQDCQVALTAAGQMDALEHAGVPDEVAAVKEVLQRALEIARDPQDPSPGPQAEGELGTAVGMAMHLANLAATAQEEAWQSRQQLQAQQQEVAQLQEQLSRARQDGERWASALQRAQREALEREATRGAEQARQQELIRDMKGRLLELLREKDALWQKTEGIDTPMPSPVPRDVGLCARCGKDFRLLSRRYNCRLCQGKVCHTCSVDVGKQGRCCLLCYQQRHPQAT